MDRPLTFLGIAGSLRRESYNRAALRAAQRLCPQGVTLETFDIAPLPLYNQDEEHAPPVVLAELKRRIRAADAIVFATPEYNYSLSGVLKNAIDCASRPYGDNAWAGKPVAIMSASVGQFGGMRAQYHLRQSLVFLDMYPVNQPEVAIPNAAKAFGPDGDLVDETSRELIRRLLAALADWTRGLQPAGPRNEAAANDEAT
jgi:chromate reductase, NAD(P)H dehydrogenase (quinone)